MRVYDVRGRLARPLLDGPLGAGVRHTTWDGRDEAGARVPSGVYVVRVEAGGKVMARPLRVVR